MSKSEFGIAVGKTKIYAYLILQEHQPKRQVIVNTAAGHQELLDWLSRQRFKQLHGCLEATSTDGHEIAKRLDEQRYRVSIANPKAVHADAESRLSRTKTDAVDARLIAEYCRDLKPTLWSPPPAEVEALQALVRRHQALERMIGQEQNRLETAVPELVDEIKAHITFIEQQQTAVRGWVWQTHKELTQQKRQAEWRATGTSRQHIRVAG